MDFLDLRAIMGTGFATTNAGKIVGLGEECDDLQGQELGIELVENWQPWIAVPDPQDDLPSVLHELAADEDEVGYHFPEPLARNGRW